MAVQVSEHAGEGVDVRIDFGVIAHRLLSSTVLNVIGWHNGNVHTGNVHVNNKTVRRRRCCSPSVRSRPRGDPSCDPPSDPEGGRSSDRPTAGDELIPLQFKDTFKLLFEAHL